MSTGGARRSFGSSSFRVIGGQNDRLQFGDNERQIKRAPEMGVTDLNKKYLALIWPKG